jgi:hypothetical protein
MVRKSGPYARSWVIANATAVFLPRSRADAGDCVRTMRPSGLVDGLPDDPSPCLFDCGPFPLPVLAGGLRQRPGRDGWFVRAPDHARNAATCRIGGRRRLAHRPDALHRHDERRLPAHRRGAPAGMQQGSAADSSDGGDCRRRRRARALPAVLAAIAAHETDATGRPAGGSAGARPLPP